MITTQKIKIDIQNPEPEIILRAANLIKAGEIVAFPTETVYGLGADALNSDAVKKIFIAKGRPQDNPLILHVSDLNQVSELVFTNDTAKALMQKFWPGALTLVMNAKEVVPLQTRGNLSTAAVRMPDNKIALSLISSAGVPIAAPSANLSGKPSPTDAQSVFDDMNGKINLILDGGATNYGIESTVIDITDEKNILLLRPGSIARENIEKFLDMPLNSPDKNNLKRSPGTRYKHYSPNIPVYIWGQKNFSESELKSAGFIGMHEPEKIFKEQIIFNSPEDYAHGLFSGFRKLESDGVNFILAELSLNSGIGLGLTDRIRRAAGVC